MAKGGAARWRIETLLLVVLVLVPFVPILHTIATHGLTRFSIEGDYAGLEAALRYVPSGRTLLGPYSRFGWNHPGPLWFYLAWPLYQLTGGGPRGLYLASALLDGIFVASIVAAMRVHAGRVGGAMACAILLAWVSAFGAMVAWPWNPATVVLPLVAFFVLASAFAAGSARSAIPTVLVGVLVAEHHVATVPTVICVSLAALLMFFVRKRSRVGRSCRSLLIAGAIAVVALLPTMIEQLTSSPGNLTKLVRFFTSRHAESSPSWAEATRDWAFGTTWLFDRASSGSVDHVDRTAPVASFLLPPVCSAYTIRMTIGLLVASVLSLVVSISRRDHTTSSLLLLSMLGNVLAIVSLHQVVGPVMYYLIFWGTASAVALWMAVAVAFGRILLTLVPNGAERVFVVASFIALVALSLVVRSFTARAMAADHALLPEPEPSLRTLEEALAARVSRDARVPVIHEGAWEASLTMLLELSRDGIEARVVPQDRWILGRQYPPPSPGERTLHVWIARTAEPSPRFACVERLVTSPRYDLFVANSDITCP